MNLRELTWVNSGDLSVGAFSLKLLCGLLGISR